MPGSFCDNHLIQHLVARARFSGCKVMWLFDTTHHAFELLRRIPRCSLPAAVIEAKVRLHKKIGVISTYRRTQLSLAP